MYRTDYYNSMFQTAEPLRVERPNWPALVNRWVLLDSTYKGWIFGILKAYDPTNGKLKIQALINGGYQFIEEYGANITRGWVVDSWTQIV